MRAFATYESACAMDCHARQVKSFVLEAALVILLGNTWFLMGKAKGFVV
jgi:hypothetical protein